MHRFKILLCCVFFGLVFYLQGPTLPAYAQEPEEPCTHCACDDPTNPCFYAENPISCCQGIETLRGEGIDVEAIIGTCGEGDPDHPCKMGTQNTLV